MNSILVSCNIQKGLIICRVVLIHPQIAYWLKLSPNPELGKTTGLSGTVQFPKTTIQQVGLQSANAQNVEAFIGVLPEELDLQGLIGYSFLQHFDYCIYYKRQEIVLTPNSSCESMS